MPDRHTLAETEKAMSAHVSDLTPNFPAAAAVSSLYRAANAVRLHLTNSVLREHGLSWTGFVVLWVVWIWDGLETRRAAASAAISKATLTGVVKTLEARGLIARRVSDTDRRLVNLELRAGKGRADAVRPTDRQSAIDRHRARDKAPRSGGRSRARLSSAEKLSPQRSSANVRSLSGCGDEVTEHLGLHWIRCRRVFWMPLNAEIPAGMIL